MMPEELPIAPSALGGRATLLGAVHVALAALHETIFGMMPDHPERPGA
jgi:hypothetical protein